MDRAGAKCNGYRVSDIRREDNDDQDAARKAVRSTSCRDEPKRRRNAVLGKVRVSKAKPKKQNTQTQKPKAPEFEPAIQDSDTIPQKQRFKRQSLEGPGMRRYSANFVRRGYPRENDSLMSARSHCQGHNLQAPGRPDLETDHDLSACRRHSDRSLHLKTS